MSSTLVIPCAGRSLRYNVNKPKWLLTDPSGDVMLVKALGGLGLSQVKRLVITVVREHVEQCRVNLDKVAKRIRAVSNLDPEFFILPDFTKSQSETVYRTITENNIRGPVWIKDCDNYFEVDLHPGNAVCVGELQDGINAVNKSYVAVDKYGYLTKIVEKHVIGNTFCAGAYGMESASRFVETFQKIGSLTGIKPEEVFVSHVIQQMLLEEERFRTVLVNNYEDFGTWRDWVKYLDQHKTLIVDIDGTLCVNSAEYFQPEWGTTAALDKNVQWLRRLYEGKRTMIVLATSRTEEYREQTLKQLQDLGVPYHQIIFGMLHAKRVVINDFAPTNPYPSALAINLKRNEDGLEELCTESY